MTVKSKIERLQDARVEAERRLRYKPLADTVTNGITRRVFEVRLDGVLLGQVREGSTLGYPRWKSYTLDDVLRADCHTRGVAARNLIPSAMFADY